jgi:hypothetical protein
MLDKLRTGLAALTLLAAVAAPAAVAAKTAEEIALAVPHEVPEVHTGGSWTDGKAQGVYRAIVVLGGVDQTTRVFVQWLAVKPDSPSSEILKMTEITEVAEKKLPNAFVTLEAEKEGEVLIVVASFDPSTNKDSTLAFKASAPGTYAVTKVPEAPPVGQAPTAAGTGTPGPANK